MENFGDNFTDVDPAADFLAREQNDLAGLEDDLNPATFNPNTNGKSIYYYSVKIVFLQKTYF